MTDSSTRAPTDAPPLVLASRSPRRAAILEMLGLDFEVVPARIPESVLPDERPREHVRRLATEKARAVAEERPDAIVLGGDTVVVLEDEILGKPGDAEEAEKMLLRLSGRSHRVLSALAMATPERDIRTRVDFAEVTFRAISGHEIEAYVATGEPLDKAGAYGIQELGSALVDSLSGDYYAVVGLSVVGLLGLFEEAGWLYRFGSLKRKD